MVFNIASAGLNIRDNRKKVSYESYCLAITELSILLFCLFLHKSLLKNEYTQRDYTKFCMFFICLILINFGFSGLVIDYYNNSRDIDDTLYNYSIAIIVINGIVLFFKGVIFKFLGISHMMM